MTLEWIELDNWCRPAGPTFTGTVPELRAYLHAKCAPDGRVSQLDVVDLNLKVDGHHNVKARTSIIVLTLPWGRYRWIPRPGQKS